VSAAISPLEQFWMPGVQPEPHPDQRRRPGHPVRVVCHIRGHPNQTDAVLAACVRLVRHRKRTCSRPGVQVEQYVRNNYYIASGNVNYTFRNGTRSASRSTRRRICSGNASNPELGIFAQDQWRIDRLTLTLGLRFDYLNGSVPTQPYPGESEVERQVRRPGWVEGGGTVTNEWFPPQTFPPVANIRPGRHQPTVGGAYDLFGNGGRP